MEIPEQLEQIKCRLTNGTHSVPVTPRELLGWFGHYRRTWRQVRAVNRVLRSLSLETDPDFEGAGFDEPIGLRIVPEPLPALPTTTTPPPTTTTTLPLGGLSPQGAVVGTTEPTPKPVDPVHRVSRFLPTGTLVAVSRDEALQVAVTKMMLHDFSQLPVMQGETKVSGMISWRSIGQRRVLGNNPQFVRECLEPHFEVKGEDSIFDAIRVIQEHDCVLVRSSENKIIGILTATDISGSFEQLSRPFLLLSYVENHLRALIQPKFKVEDLQTAKDPADADRQISDVSDMTFGEYLRLLENPENWAKLGIGIERSLFVSQLNDVREIRNDVMHFNPEGIEEKDMETLRRFSSFLQSIVALLPKV